MFRLLSKLGAEIALVSAAGAFIGTVLGIGAGVTGIFWYLGLL